MLIPNARWSALLSFSTLLYVRITVFKGYKTYKGHLGI